MEEDRGNCPNCGHIKINTDTCLRCGIVYSKYQRVTPEIISEITREPQTKQKGPRKGGLISILILLLVIAFVVYKYFSPDVKVYVEGTYTENEVEAYVYADVNVSCLNTFGAQLIYHPSQFSIIEVELNDELWYHGDKAIYDAIKNIEHLPPEVPETDAPFDEIFFSGMKIYECDGYEFCRRCISGKKILLGKVTFSRNDTTMPFDPSFLFIAPIRGNDGNDKYRYDFIKADGPQKSRNPGSRKYLKSRKVKCGPIKFKEAI